MLTLFVGAGFSKWAVDLPVASELFDFAIDPHNESEARKLEAVRKIKEGWDAIHPSKLSEQFIADALDFKEDQRHLVLWYIVRRLSEMFIWREFHAQRWRRHTLMIDENRKFEIPGVVKARNFLQQFCSPSSSGIVTSNYDLVVEYALGTKVFNYGIRNQILSGRGPYPVSTWRNPVRLRGSIPLAKIHGSVSWDEKGYYTDGRRGLTGKALIVAPTPEKTPPRSLKHPWKLAKKILRNTSHLVVFGFAFNPYDKAVLTLLQSEGRSVKHILIIDVKPNLATASSLWPEAKIISARPPPEGSLDIASWWEENG